MRKFFPYSFWNCEKLETFLNDMERNGCRLTGVNFGFFFEFTKSKPREVRYIYVTSADKDFSFWDNEHWLLSTCNGDIIIRDGFARIYRICDTTVSLSEFTKHRRLHFIRTARHRALYQLLFAALFGFFLIPFGNGSIEFFVCLAGALLMLATMIYNCVGMIVLKKTIK